ncbi:hypothetical protein QNK09_01860 [Brevibacillus agri]|uniref:HEAT repeat domain-containing protein n=1 Tax=Brevibacillus agri TaxID=51101 RepID=UPI0024C037D5|nr:hypothetical protein [Brevibacillus agri]WHX31034.1 hypothetical protein QNK09_01860 [Brevibacillus agri]
MSGIGIVTMLSQLRGEYLCLERRAKMKALSKEMLALIAELYQKPAVHASLHETQQRRTDILHTIAESASLLALPFLLPFAMRVDDPFGKLARRAVQHSLQRHGKQGLISLDQYIRRLTAYQHADKLGAWHELSPASIEAFPIQDEADASFVGLCSFHRNGYVREAAVVRLAREASGAELPFLLLRLNDWQPKIRFLAYKALKQRLRSAYAPHFLESVCLVDHLVRYYHREKFTDLVDGIFALLQHPAQRAVLTGGFRSKDLHVRRFSFELALQAEGGEQEAVWRAAMAQSDAFIRQRISTLLVKNHLNVCLSDGLKLMRNDVFPPIRQLALQTYVERYPEKAGEALTAALLDPHKNIRELARFYLKDQGVDFAACYREKCAGTDERQLLAAIAGVGETGDKADANRLLPFLADERTRVRRTTVKAIAMLDPEPYIELFFRSLQSEKRSESREARRVLGGMVDLRHSDKLWEIFTGEADTHVKKNILYLFTQFGKGDGILHVLRACATDEAEVRAEAIRHVQLWVDGCNKRFYVPFGAERREQMEAVLAQVQAVLPAALAEELRFLIRK